MLPPPSALVIVMGTPRTKLEGEVVLPEGTTPGWVELSRTKSGVYILALLGEANPENRWIPGLNAAMMKAYEAIEKHLETEAGDTPAALLTVSNNPKFFSNGIDPDGQYVKKLNLPAPSASPAEQAAELSVIGLPSFTRPLQLPIPTVAAINGHAFGAGMMFAISHDYRLQREDRWFMCAIEIEIGVGFPTPEMDLFRHVMSKPSWYQTVMGAKRWGAQDSLREGLIVKACGEEVLFSESLKFAEEQARLAKGKRGRALFNAVKNQVKGQVMQAVMHWAFPGGEFPEPATKFPNVVAAIKQKYPYFLKHIGEEVEELPDGELFPGGGRLAAQDTYNRLYKPKRSLL